MEMSSERYSESVRNLSESESYRKEIRELRAEINKLTLKLEKNDSGLALRFINEIGAFLEGCDKADLDHYHCAAFHTACGSTGPQDGIYTKLDFAGEYNIRNFLLEKLAEYEKMLKKLEEGRFVKGT